MKKFVCNQNYKDIFFFIPFWLEKYMVNLRILRVYYYELDVIQNYCSYSFRVKFNFFIIVITLIDFIFYFFICMFIIITKNKKIQL